MKSQKLGRGLDALLGEMDEVYDKEGSQKDSILEIPLKDIRPNPFQPRKSFDEDSLHELSESIKNDGLLQPIVVSEDIDGYVLIAGERRFRASKLAKLTKIKAVVLNSDERRMRQFALIENIQREELNSIELSQAYSELIKLHNITHEELSVIIHKSRSHITNILRLLQLSPRTQKALVEKKITTGHAKVLIGLDEKKQQVIVDSIIGQKLSVRDVEKMIKEVRKPFSKEKVSIKKSEIDRVDLNALEDKFKDIGVQFKVNYNKIILEFNSNDEVLDFFSHIK